MNKEDADFHQWLSSGIERGWISEPYCGTHDLGLAYMGEDEYIEWQEGKDPCATVLRILMPDYSE